MCPVVSTDQPHEAAAQPDPGATEAARRIGQAALEGAWRLDLRGLGLVDLPPLPADWCGPVELDLSDNALTTWPTGLERWTALQHLRLDGNPLPTAAVPARWARPTLTMARSPETIAQFAAELNRPSGALLKQLQSAGVAKQSPEDLLTDADKERLLDYLRSKYAATGGTRKKIVLMRKSTSDIKQAGASDNARIIQVEVRKKRVFVARDKRPAGPNALAVPQAAGAAPPEGVKPPKPEAPMAALVPDVPGPLVAGIDVPPAALPPADRKACPRGNMPTPPEAEPVDCTVFAPPRVGPVCTFLLQAFLHAPSDAAAEEARRRALDADPQAGRRGGVSLPLDVAPGSRIDLHLEWPGLQVDEPDATLRWSGRLLAAQFEVTVPAATPVGAAVGRLRVAVDGMPAGTLRFQVAVSAAAGDASSVAQALPGQPTRYRRAFVSYSSLDRAEVLRRVQAFRIAGIEVFQDVLSLDPGERWARGLWTAIDDCDLFLLFWSEAARRSEWVAREIAHALARKGGQADADTPPAIQPVPIEGPPIPLPPLALGALHFNDALLAHLAVNPLH
jgi:hypothetical protein